MAEKMPYGFSSDVWPGLSKLVEECGESLEILGKIMGCGGQLIHKWACKDCEGGGAVYPPGQSWADDCPRCDGVGYLGSGDLTDAIHEEIADLLAAATFFVKVNEGIDDQRVWTRATEKVRTFERWRRDQVF